jgi:hypothetical protein
MYSKADIDRLIENAIRENLQVNIFLELGQVTATLEYNGLEISKASVSVDSIEREINRE